MSNRDDSNLVEKMLKELKGIRPKRYKRLIILDIILKEYAYRIGVDYEDLVGNLRPKIIRRAISKMELELTDELEHFILGVTDRALEDYIKMLKYFRRSEK